MYTTEHTINQREDLTMTTIKLHNDFHGSSATIRAAYGQVLSASQVRRARNALCGVSGCLCGGELGQRGRSNSIVASQQDRDGKVRVRILAAR
jgi:hypothetical protein